jgi:hypothetical protein
LGIGLRLTPNPRTINSAQALGLSKWRWSVRRKGFDKFGARRVVRQSSQVVHNHADPAGSALPPSSKRQMRRPPSPRICVRDADHSLFAVVLSIGELFGYLEPDRKANGA